MRTRFYVSQLVASTALAGALALSGVTMSTAHHPDEAQYFQIGNMTVSHAWTYETVATAHSGRVYLTIQNVGQEADRLIDVSVTFAGHAHIQGQAVDADGVVAVREFEAIEIAPAQTVTFQPGALWIELEGMQRTFSYGDHFHMEMTFENAGTLEIDVEVEDVDDADHDHDDTSS
ncbi:MAG: copper chaperone PCu(A)C [Pseudomonadota bacterium]